MPVRPLYSTSKIVTVPPLPCINVLRASSLAAGHSGIRVETLDLLVEILNRGVTPVVPAQGSVGASGDLAPLAHMTLTLIGEGEAFYREFLYEFTRAVDLIGRAYFQDRGA